MARQRQTGSYTWTQVKSVQNLIERCLSQYMTQAEVRGPVSGIGVLRCLHAIDATRFHQTRSWVVYFLILRPFGPSRETACSAQDTSRGAEAPPVNGEHVPFDGCERSDEEEQGYDRSTAAMGPLAGACCSH